VAANALPEGYSGPSPPPAPPPAPAGPLGDNLVESPNISATTSDKNNSNSSTLPSSLNEKSTKSLVIALLAVNGVFVLGTLTALFFYVSRKRSREPQGIHDSSGSEFAPLHVEKAEYYSPYHHPSSPGTPEKS